MPTAKLARAQNAYLHRELANAIKNAPVAPTDASPQEQVRLEVQDLRQRYATLKLYYEEAKARIVTLEGGVAYLRKQLGWQSDDTTLLGVEARLDDILLRLLSIAHPDLWSQGQPANQLAHELTLTINAIREEVQP